MSPSSLTRLWAKLGNPKSRNRRGKELPRKLQIEALEDRCLLNGATPVLINCGGGPVGNFSGDEDLYFQSPVNPATTTATIDTSKVSNPAPQPVWQSENWGQAFNYYIPGLTPGASYTVQLDFAQLANYASGQDQFNVSINNQQVLKNFDIVKATGGSDIAVAEAFTTTADSNGGINIQFNATSVYPATINGIEINPAGASTPPPTVATAASANPNPVTGTSTALSVLGADQAGESTLTYNWTEVSGPSGDTFSANGTNAAKNTTVTFTQAGTYTFLATITDPTDQSVTSPVSVTVNQTLSAISVSPASVSLPDDTTQKFAATEHDQFGNVLTSPLPISWSIQNGGVGTINSSTGVYSAPSSGPGSATIQATSGAVFGTATVTDVQSTPPPTVATPAAANPNPVTGTSTALSVLGSDQAGESTLTYHWAETSGPASVSFSGNGTNAAKNTTATFTQAGTYSFQVTISDPLNQSVTSTVSVTVNQTLSAITVSPASASVPDGTTQQFSDTEVDQFGNSIATPLPITWSIQSGGAGTISSTGLYTAPASGNGSATILATSGAVFGTASATDDASSPAPLVTISAGEGSVPWPGGPVATFGGDNYDTTVGGGNSAFVGAAINTSNVNVPAPQAVYQHEVWGRQLTYSIPGFTPGNSYQVRLDFAEIVYSSAGQDLENVSINGTQVLTGFDKFAAAGGKDIAIAEQFSATADSNGYITIVFTGQGTDAATVQGIEIYPGVPPTVATPAAANPYILTGTTTALSVLGADQAGESILSYKWAETSGPTNGVTFSANNTNAAKNTTAIFNQAGNYTFQVIISDPYGQSVISTVSQSVTVDQTLTGITVSPPGASVLLGTTLQFAANQVDQFGNTMANQQPVSWSIENGGAGSINSTSGLYTAAASNGSATIQAVSGAFSATATVQDVAAVVFSPTNLSATPGNAKVTLSWTAPSGANAGYTYNIYRDNNGPGKEQLLQSGVSGTTFVDSTVSNNTTYYYYVTAFSANVESNPSNEQAATPVAPPSGYIWDPSLTNIANGGTGTWAPSTPNWYFGSSGDVVLPASGADAVFQGNPSLALMDTAGPGGQLNLHSLSLANTNYLLDQNINVSVQNQIGTLNLGSGVTTLDWNYATNSNSSAEQWTVGTWAASQGSAVVFDTNNLGAYKGGADPSLFTVTNPATLGQIGGGAAWVVAGSGAPDYGVSIVPNAVFDKNDVLPFYNFVGYNTSTNSLTGLGAGDEGNDQDIGTIGAGEAQDNVYLNSPQVVQSNTTINSLVVDELYHPNVSPDVTGPGTLTITSGSLLFDAAPAFSAPINFPEGGHIFMGNNTYNLTGQAGALVNFSPDVQSSISGTGGLTITGQLVPQYINNAFTDTLLPNTNAITFSGNSTYTGTTTINAADVVISNPSNFGDPTQAHTVVLNGYSILAPNQNDFLNSNYSLTLNAGSELNTTGISPDANGASTTIGNIEFGAGSQGSTITAGTVLAQNQGTVTIDPGAVLNVALTAAPQIGNKFTVITGVQSFNGTFAQVNGTYGGNTYTLTPSYTGGNLVLTATYGGIPFTDGGTIAPASVPGTIFFSNFDTVASGSGNAVTYYTPNPTTAPPSSYRPDVTTIELSGNLGGTVFGTNNAIITNGWGFGAHGSQGEWAIYTVNVPVAGTYSLQIETANNGEAGSGLAHIDIDGSNVTGPINVPGFGSWNIFYDQTVATNINLTAGTHLVQLFIDNQAGMTFNWMKFTPSS